MIKNESTLDYKKMEIFKCTQKKRSNESKYFIFQVTSNNIIYLNNYFTYIYIYMCRFKMEDILEDAFSSDITLLICFYLKISKAHVF